MRVLEAAKARRELAAIKPPYRVPLMSEVRELPWNGFNVASFFAGTGGSSTGYRMAGFRVLYANEFVEAARESYAANAAPYTVIDGRDIRTIDPSDVLAKIGLDVGALDVLDGSPPCASFSTAGKREKGWGEVKAYSDTVQRSDDLFFEFARMIDGIRPKVFVAENVSGLVKGVAKGYFLDILADLKGRGYRVRSQVLDAQWLGVPQMRQRLIFVGVREDLNVEPRFPRPLPYRYSIRDALPHIVRARRHVEYAVSYEDAGERPASAIVASDGAAGEGRLFSDSFVEAERIVDVVGGNKAPFDSKGKRYDLDAPIATICGGDTLGLGPYQFELAVERGGLGTPPDTDAAFLAGSPSGGLGTSEESAIVHGHGSATREKRGTPIDPDGPAPSILAGSPSGGRGADQFAIVHGPGANAGQRGGVIDGDGPAPTILAGGGSARPKGGRDRSDQMLVAAVSTKGGELRSLDEPAPTILTHGRANTQSEMTLAVEPESDISRFAVGAEWDKLREGEQSDKYFQLVRPDSNAPSPTVTAAGGNASTASVTHPTERRKFSIAELRRLGGFPDDFVLTGTYAQQWERIGRAVPPVMMAKIAGVVADLLREIDARTSKGV